MIPIGSAETIQRDMRPCIVSVWMSRLRSNRSRTVSATRSTTSAALPPASRCSWATSASCSTSRLAIRSATTQERLAGSGRRAARRRRRAASRSSSARTRSPRRPPALRRSCARSGGRTRSPGARRAAARRSGCAAGRGSGSPTHATRYGTPRANSAHQHEPVASVDEEEGQRSQRRTFRRRSSRARRLDVGDLERLLEARPPRSACSAVPSSVAAAVAVLRPCPAAGRGSRRTRPSAPAGRFASAAGSRSRGKRSPRRRASARRSFVIGESKMRLPIDGLYGGGCRGADRAAPVSGSRSSAVPTPFTLHLDADGLVRVGLRLVLEQVLARDLLAELRRRSV